MKKEIVVAAILLAAGCSSTATSHNNAGRYDKCLQASYKLDIAFDVCEGLINANQQQFDYENAHTDWNRVSATPDCWAYFDAPVLITVCWDGSVRIAK